MAGSEVLIVCVHKVERFNLLHLTHLLHVACLLRHMVFFVTRLTLLIALVGSINKRLSIHCIRNDCLNNLLKTILQTFTFFVCCFHMCDHPLTTHAHISGIASAYVGSVHC